MLTDPIVALATPPGRSAVAVIRLSGRGVFEIAARVIPSFRPDPPREARLAAFRDADGALIDRGLYLVFPAPRSETGEDMVELHSHGGLAVPARLVAVLETAGARPAHPGEFTRRAVQHGKLDLIQAEAVGDLVDAEVPAQARAALSQLEGGLSRRIGELRDALVELLALLAYDVDFPEEDDGVIPRARIETARADVARRIDQLLATAPLAERVRRGALVVLAGPPNAGKSSLFNALLGTQRALVTEVPGTTRDAIEAHADFLGWPVRLVDTAGLGETSDRIDAMGQEVSQRYAAAADLVLLCGDEPAAPAPVAPEKTLRVRTKADLGGAGGDVAVSAVTGEGLDRLRRLVAERLFAGGVALADLEPVLTRERHRVALARAAAALAAARPEIAPGGDAVLASHHVQEAVRALDSLIGVVDVEEVLDRVFASFCVGK
ncbi:MAG TPA: tRNA uridine-5-carboxymethylaminomethyl(34) synthesis GTPase MnmE [Gemmatimonadales bacterium]|nr:tRNA uridine-5-carboxymethylaminomethyl(34) synthesis GTPase MnmE [Gemmatimonadales bacterium]